MRTIASVVAAGAIVLGLTSAGTAQDKHVLATPAQAQWGPAPPMLPPGAQIAVLSGDPTKAQPYSVRLKMPANYAVPAHSHPTDENVVIVTGALTLGMGDELRKGIASNTTLRSGGYALMPANMNHFAYTTGAETTIILYGTGPVEFKYVKASDDPRNAKKGSE